MSGSWENLPAGHGRVVLDEPTGEDRRRLTLCTGCLLCQRCCRRAAEKLRDLPGVRDVALTWDMDRVVVDYFAAVALGEAGDRAPEAVDIRRWAEKILEIIEGEARTRHHECACGSSGEPGSLV